MADEGHLGLGGYLCGVGFSTQIRRRYYDFDVAIWRYRRREWFWSPPGKGRRECDYQLWVRFLWFALSVCRLGID